MTDSQRTPLDDTSLRKLDLPSSLGLNLKLHTPPRDSRQSKEAQSGEHLPKDETDGTIEYSQYNTRAADPTAVSDPDVSVEVANLHLMSNPPRVSPAQTSSAEQASEPLRAEQQEQLVDAELTRANDIARGFRKRFTGTVSEVEAQQATAIVDALVERAHQCMERKRFSDAAVYRRRAIELVIFLAPERSSPLFDELAVAERKVSAQRAARKGGETRASQMSTADHSHAGSKGGKALARIASPEQRREWGRKGGRPRKKPINNDK